MPATLASNARLLKLCNLCNTFSVHLLVLPIQPAAQDDANKKHQQGESSRDPGSFAVEWRLGVWENVRSQQWPELSDRCEYSVSTRPLTFSSVDVGRPG